MTELAWQEQTLDTDLFQGSARNMVIAQREDARERGLSDCFLHGTPVDEVIIASDVENLDLVPSGLIPPNPAQALGSKQLHDLLEDVRNRYDLVVLDSPPLTGALDVAFLAAVVDGIVVVIKSGSTARNLVRKVVEQLKTAKGNLIGVVLNFADVPADALGSYHYYYYSPQEGAPRRRSRRRRTVDAETREG